MAYCIVKDSLSSGIDFICYSNKSCIYIDWKVDTRCIPIWQLSGLDQDWNVSPVNMNSRSINTLSSSHKTMSFYSQDSTGCSWFATESSLEINCMCVKCFKKFIVC